MICTFFGNKDTPDYIRLALYQNIEYLITNKNVDTFYVGNNGNFDRLVKSVLKQLKTIYPNINYWVVLAYLPQKNNYDDYSDTIFPMNFETIPPKIAIIKRNEWMLNKSDFVITYVCNIYGNARKFKDLSIKKNKKVIELYENQTSHTQ